MKRNTPRYIIIKKLETRIKEKIFMPEKTGTLCIQNEENMDDNELITRNNPNKETVEQHL